VDTTIVDHEKRLTRLEDKVGTNLPVILSRIEALEADLMQRQSDKEQAQRKEMGEVRKQLAEAEATVAELKKAAEAAEDGES
jgi:hypothetical protein